MMSIGQQIASAINCAYEYVQIHDVMYDSLQCNV